MSILFRDFIVRDALISNLSATNKLGAITEMVDALVAAGALTEDQQPGIVAALLSRERICTTAIGHGMAIPHGKHPGVHKLIGTFAHSHDGVPYDAADGEPVNLFFLLLSNQSETARHLEALAFISRCLRDDLFQSFLRNTNGVQDIQAVLDTADQQA